MNPNRTCNVLAVLSAAGFGALTVYAAAARVVAPLRLELQRNRWEIRLMNKEMQDARARLFEALPTSKAIAGYAICELFAKASDSDGEAGESNVRQLHG